MSSWPGQLDILLDENSIVQNSHPGWPEEFSSGIKLRRLKDNIIRLPFTGLTAGINQRRVLAINCSSHPIGVSLIFVGIQHLNLI